MSNTPREDVIKLAREAGFAVGIGSPALPKFTHLIQLVKAEEREACAKVCETTAWTSSIDEWRDMTKKDVADKSMHACAAAIRARSNT